MSKAKRLVGYICEVPGKMDKRGRENGGLILIQIAKGQADERMSANEEKLLLEVCLFIASRRVLALA